MPPIFYGGENASLLASVAKAATYLGQDRMAWQIMRCCDTLKDVGKVASFMGWNVSDLDAANVALHCSENAILVVQVEIPSTSKKYYVCITDGFVFEITELEGKKLDATFFQDKCIRRVLFLAPLRSPLLY